MIDTENGLALNWLIPAIVKIVMGQGLSCPEALSSAFVSLDAYYREYKVSFLRRMRN